MSEKRITHILLLLELLNLYHISTNLYLCNLPAAVSMEKPPVYATEIPARSVLARRDVKLYLRFFLNYKQAEILKNRNGKYSR